MLETTSNKIVYEIKSDSKIFAFPIRFFQPSDIVCYLDNVELENGVDFSVETKTDYSSGANITLNIPVSAGSKLAILRILPEIQETSLPEYGKLPSTSLEKQLDKDPAFNRRALRIKAHGLPADSHGHELDRQTPEEQPDTAAELGSDRGINASAK